MLVVLTTSALETQGRDQGTWVLVGVIEGVPVPVRVPVDIGVSVVVDVQVAVTAWVPVASWVGV